mmetsp:Transcript_41779/g.111949  ORF Transcript_41779/g.111949 Transcript_41779/m.111949 type:complete len:166 (-) Transcript_41779:36-533(-)
MDRCVKIYPRRKASVPFLSNHKKQCPIILTKQSLSNLFCLSLNEACSVLGISPTTLKCACRKVGIKKWPRKVPVNGVMVTFSDDAQDSSDEGHSVEEMMTDPNQDELDVVFGCVNNCSLGYCEDSQQTYDDPQESDHSFSYCMTIQRFGTEISLEMPEINLPFLS